MTNEQNNRAEQGLLRVIRKLLGLIVFLLFLLIGLLYLFIFGAPKFHTDPPPRDASSFSQSRLGDKAPVKQVWLAPDTSALPKNEPGNNIRYGRALIANTAIFLGPHGTVAPLSNGMNCQNCHLAAGTAPFGNNYSAVASTYPKFRERSGKSENIYKRVNDCFERSLNGQGLDSNSREMQAIKAYICWLGTAVPKGVKPAGSGIADLPYLDWPADPLKGKALFQSKCVSCHGSDGQGKLNVDGNSYQYPPLWGAHSYNTGAGLYRLTRFAGYIKNNMPQGATYLQPQLSDEESWDLAAFVNTQQRPKGNISKDWPKLSGKPIDNPFGPYADNFSEAQHKFGPYGPIQKARSAASKKTDPLFKQKTTTP